MKKRNKLLPLFGVLALVLAFFASAKASYADNDYTGTVVTGSNVTWYANWGEFIATEYGYSYFSYGTNNNNFGERNAKSAGYVDMRIVVQDKFDFSSAALNKKCSGTFQSRETFSISASAVNNSDVEIMFTGLDTDPSDYDIVDFTTRTESNFDSTNGRTLTVNMNVISYFADREFSSNTVYLQHTMNFRIYFMSSAFNALGVPHITVNRTSGPNNVGSLRYGKSTEDLLANMNNSITTDSSGNASALASEVTSYDTAESLASTSMAGALPSADTQLSQITQYDYGSLYTDNVSAFAFWKSLGDFVLSNSNLVGIGALLILCLFLGLVVYLLRL